MADGSLWIIDFNDWPSFAPCREEAARAIARRVKGSDPIPTFPKGKE
jgi:hypothetical protein